MIMICIDNSNYANLTIGKKYTALFSSEIKYPELFETITILDDVGNVTYVCSRYFSTIEEYREIKIENILDGQDTTK